MVTSLLAVLMLHLAMLILNAPGDGHGPLTLESQMMRTRVDTRRAVWHDERFDAYMRPRMPATAVASWVHVSRGLGFRVSGLGSRVSGLGSLVSGFRFESH